MKEGIPFTPLLGSKSIISEKYFDGLQKHEIQIDTRKYHDYTIHERYFCEDCKYTRINEMRLTCSVLF